MIITHFSFSELNCELKYFTGEWDTKNNEMKYTKSYEGIVSQEDEEVTSAMCIPLVSKKKTSPGAPDWTCVILGFNDGQVKMYTENGSLLISQMFHNQPVKAIKCRSYQPAATAMKHDQLEEVFILYQTVLVTMDGFGLFQTLRGCRSHIARCMYIFLGVLMMCRVNCWN